MKEFGCKTSIVLHKNNPTDVGSSHQVLGERIRLQYIGGDTQDTATAIHIHSYTYTQLSQGAKREITITKHRISGDTDIDSSHHMRRD